MTKITYQKGDLLILAQAGAFDAIAHGCNCFCAMGGGIARAIAIKFPEAEATDSRTKRGDMSKLGTCEVTPIVRGAVKFDLINAYTQYGFSAFTSGPAVDYDAIEKCVKWINLIYKGKHVGFPKIGAGLAGGDWDKIEKIIEENAPDIQVTVICFE